MAKRDRREYQREYYRKNPRFRAHKKQKAKERRDREKQRKRDFWVQWRVDRGCQICGETNYTCLTAHHLYPDTKKDSVANLIHQWGKTIDDMRAELAKCMCLCHNCHSKYHAAERRVKGES